MVGVWAEERTLPRVSMLRKLVVGLANEMVRWIALSSAATWLGTSGSSTSDYKRSACLQRCKMTTKRLTRVTRLTQQFFKATTLRVARASQAMQSECDTNYGDIMNVL